MTQTGSIVDLEALGIEETDSGVCEDTFTNRRILRGAKLRWKLVPGDSSDAPTGLIEVVDARWLDSDQVRMHDRFRDILADPDDPWGDYLPANQYPMDATGVPYWLYRRVEKWERWVESEGKPVEPGTAGAGVVAKRHAGREPYLPTRCVTIKRNGARCWGWCFDTENDGRCRAHAPGQAFAANKGHHLAARAKLVEAMPAMVDELEGMVYDPEAPHNVRLKAITEMMDRGGIRAGSEVDVSGTVSLDGGDAADVIRARLGDLAERLAEARRDEPPVMDATDVVDVVDAEVVE